MTSKLIDKMLPSATNHKVDVTVKTSWEAKLIREGGGEVKLYMSKSQKNFLAKN